VFTPLKPKDGLNGDPASALPRGKVFETQPFRPTYVGANVVHPSCFDGVLLDVQIVILGSSRDSPAGHEQQHDVNDLHG
jgi:hypothetical protein